MKLNTLIGRCAAIGLLAFASLCHAQTCTTTSLGFQVDVPYFFTQSNAPQWDPNKVYKAGDVVQDSYEFQARWWTQGDNPNQDGGTEVWKATVQANGMPQEWLLNHIYYGGEQAIWRGVAYAAKWWTRQRPDGTDWQYVRTVDPFGRVKLGGNDQRQACSQSLGGTGGRVTTTDTVNWSILEDPDHTVAYWKIIGGQLPGQGSELERGTSRQGSYSATSTMTMIYYPSGPVTTYSGQTKDLYLCSASDVCRKLGNPS